MKIAFHTEQIDVRGTCVSLYDYAHYNETLLKNKSIIFTSTKHIERNDILAYNKFKNRFPVYFYSSAKELDNLLEQEDCDILYIIKYGTNDNFISNKIKTVIHAVFDLSQPHGNVFAAVSETLAKKYKYPIFVPHMIAHKPSRTQENLRKELNIPNTAFVFGRYGGKDTFNLSFVMNSIKKMVREREDLYFLFINTPIFDKHPRIFFREKIVSEEDKNKFICTCDAHLEASTLGHTFGLAMGEFSVNNKPIIAYNGKIWNTNHLEILKDKGLYFRNAEEFEKIIKGFDKEKYKNIDMNCYRDFSPEKVMLKFKEVFIDL